MKIKVLTEDLKMGMYISELDIPWIESPFLFQGFQLKDEEEMQQLRDTCKYVYVDTEKTPYDVKPNLQTITPVAQKPTKKRKVPSSNSDFTNTVTLKKSNFDKI